MRQARTTARRLAAIRACRSLVRHVLTAHVCFLELDSGSRTLLVRAATPARLVRRLQPLSLLQSQHRSLLGEFPVWMIQCAPRMPRSSLRLPQREPVLAPHGRHSRCSLLCLACSHSFHMEQRWRLCVHSRASLVRLVRLLLLRLRLEQWLVHRVRVRTAAPVLTPALMHRSQPVRTRAHVRWTSSQGSRHTGV